MKLIIFYIFLFFTFHASTNVPFFDEDCDMNVEIDLMFAVDNTQSLRWFRTELINILGRLLNELVATYPQMRFGFVSFNDRSLRCQTSNGFFNYCAKLHHGLTNDYRKIENIIRTSECCFGGGRVPEDTLGALLVGSAHRDANWSPVDLNKNRKRIILVATDDMYREHTARTDCPGPHFRPNDGDGDYDCVNENYPTVDQVRAAMFQRGIMPFFLLANPRQDFRPVYQNLIQLLGQKGSVFSGNVNSQIIFDVIKQEVYNFVCEYPPAPVPPNAIPSTSTPTISQPNKESSNNGKIIASASAGAVFGLAALGGTAFYLTQSSSSPSNEFEGRFSMEEDMDEDVPDKEQVINLDDSGYA